MLRRTEYEECPICFFEDCHSEHFQGDCTAHPLYSPKLPNVMNWKCCKRCEHIYTDGYFEGAALEELLSRHNPHQVASSEQMRGLNGRIVSFVEACLEKMPQKSRRRPKTWFDVGCGDGGLIMTAEEYGFDVGGIDIRMAAVSPLRDRNLAVIHGDFIEAPLPLSPYTVISMCDVLEHMPFPIDALSKALDSLASGGVLLISTPNSDTYLWQEWAKQYGTQHPYYAELEHYHCFSRKRLCELFGQFSFEMLGYRISEKYRSGMEVVFGFSK